MSFAFLLSLLFTYFVGNIESQSLFRGQQSPIDRLPGVGACDRIASRGVANCMENFLPTNVLSGFTGGPRGGSGGDICCSYSKYKACINGLHAGLRIAMEREKCPKSYSTKIIKSMGDSFVGLPLKSFCGSENGRSKCPKRGNTKPKNSKPAKRTPNRREESSSDPIGSAFKPIGDIFGGRNTNKREGGSSDSIGSVFQPVSDIFGGRNTNRDNKGNDPSFLGPVGDVFNKGRETFEQGASSILGGAQNIFGGLGGLGKNNN